MKPGNLFFQGAKSGGRRKMRNSIHDASESCAESVIFYAAFQVKTKGI